MRDSMTDQSEPETRRRKDAPGVPGRRATRRRLLAIGLIALALLPMAPPSVRADEAASPRSLLLVASDRLNDANFSRSVVLVTQHGGGGPLGIVLNRPTDLKLGDVFDGEPALRERKDRLFLGGPVSRHTLVFLLRVGPQPKNAVELLAGVFMSLDAEDGLRRLREGAADGEVRVFAGYAGWAPGQLEREIARGDWHLLPADADIILTREPGALWENLVRRASLKTVRHDAPAPQGAPIQVRNRTADTPGT